MTENTCQAKHIPVLLKECLETLAPEAGDTVLDGTLGSGGHARAFLEVIGAEGHLIGIDQDEAAIARTEHCLGEFSGKVTLIHDNFAHAAEVWHANLLPAPNIILLDLGWSTDQFTDACRGFSFQLDGPLDMRLDPSRHGQLTAYDLVNTLDPEPLSDILYHYGEERYARRIAREIAYHRMEFGPIETTSQLVEIIKASVPSSYLRTRIHPATRTFQALRIAVNDELGTLERALPNLLSILAPGGRLGIISFHSLEDRIVKQTFKTWKDEDKGSLLTKKPIAPAKSETDHNPKSRSAKLRVFQSHHAYDQQ